MNKNLNLSEILKDCPKGTKFYSTIYGDVYFDCIDLLSPYPVTFKTFEGEMTAVTNSGLNHSKYNGECTFFPSREQRDWSEWHLPFVDGDIIFTYIKGDICDNKWLSIFRRAIDNRCETYVDLYIEGNRFFDDTQFFDDSQSLCFISDIKEQRLATEEERRKLFDVIKEKGYKWNAEAKMMEKLPKDRFDPKTLKPFDKALVRIDSDDNWHAVFFSHIEDINGEKFVTTAGMCYKQMIPYNENTKHLLGTNNEAPEYYKCWED